MTSRPWRIALISSVALAVFPFCYLAVSAVGIPPGFRTFVAFVLSAAIGMLTIKGLSRAHKWSNTSVDVNVFFTHNNSEKNVISSHVESMIAAGDGAKATAALASLIAEHGLDERLCRLAVDFHFSKLGDSARAESLLHRMRVERPESYERYATARLIDLYMSDVATYPNAMKELRRLVATYPGSIEAKGAEACIERLRAFEASVVASTATTVRDKNSAIPTAQIME